LAKFAKKLKLQSDDIFRFKENDASLSGFESEERTIDDYHTYIADKVKKDKRP
jgi:hypothetical protein